MGRVCVGGEHLFTSISLSPLGFLCGYVFHLSRFSLGLGTQSQMVHTVDSPGLPIIGAAGRVSSGSLGLWGGAGGIKFSELLRSPGPRGQQPNSSPSAQPASFSTRLCPASCRLRSALFLLHVPTGSYLKRPLRLPWAPTQPGPPGQQPSPDSATSNHSLQPAGFYFCPHDVYRAGGRTGRTDAFQTPASVPGVRTGVRTG